MIKRLISRLIEFIVVLFIGVTIIFIIIHLGPGDPSLQFCSPTAPLEQRELLMHRFGLDQPLWKQYTIWLKNAVIQFDFGISFFSGKQVGKMVRQALSPTLLLTGLALLFGILAGVFLGIQAAIRQNKFFDRFVTTIMFAFYSMPSFWLGLILLQIFAVQLNWLASSQLVSVFHEQFSCGARLWDYCRHLILPVSTLGLIFAASFYRYSRNAMLTALSSEYILAAQARGTPRNHLIYRYALGNSLLPLISLVGTSLPVLFSGALMIEVVFGLPGLGRLMTDAVLTRDYPVIVAAALLSFFAAIIGNLMADIIYLIVDPRLRHS